LTAPGADIVYCIHDPRIDEIISDSRGYSYHVDGLGSTVNLTDANGNEAASYSYDAFGNLTSSTGSVTNPWLYTGRYLDSESGLYYYRNRYYDPRIGRFITRDPLGLADSPNPYLYVLNNPVNLIDPLGLRSQKPWWQKLEEGYYYGTGFGGDAAEWYAYQQLQTDNPLWALPGSIVSLWMSETYQTTASTLLLAAQLNQIISAKYWQYYPADNPAYKTRYIARGSNSPYQTGEKAVKALNLPQPRNPGTAVRRIDVKPWEPVRGPRPVSGGTGTEYYRGWRWPKR